MSLLSLMIGTLCCHVQMPIMQNHETIQSTPFKLTFGYNPRTPAGQVVEVVHPASAAFVERLQSALSLARKCFIAAQRRQKAFADERRVEKVYKVGDKVLLIMKYLNLKHSETNRKLLLKWIGPFEAVQLVGSVAYELEMNPGWRFHPVFHVLLWSRTGKAAGYNPHHFPLKWKARSSMRWSRFLNIDFGALGTPKRIIRFPGRVMVSSITLGSQSRTS
jgi:hypothetical protein